MNGSLASKNIFGAVKGYGNQVGFKGLEYWYQIDAFREIHREIIGEDFSAITAKTSSLIKVKKSN